MKLMIPKGVSYLRKRLRRGLSTTPFLCNTKRDDDSQPPQSQRITAVDNDSGYMKRRLEQLAEQAGATPDDPMAGVPKDALPYNRIELHAKLDKIRDDNFDAQYQKEIGISKLPTYASKHTRDLAMSQAWSGKENVYDASLRMLNDKYKPIKQPKSGKGGPLFTPKLSVKERISNARDTALDYKISKLNERYGDKSKKQEPLEEEDDFAERYKERLLGPALFLNDSFSAVDNSITSLADQKIREAQRNGEFKNISRGKPLDKDFTSSSAYIDRTEYHLNKILKKQDAIPPWIEKQGSVEVEIKRFRSQLDKDWQTRAVNLVNELNLGKTFDERLQRLKSYVDAEINNKNGRLRSKEWESKEENYLTTKLRKLNDSMRGYNLQAPLASQKLYLIKEKELENCYKRVAVTLVEAYKRHSLGLSEKLEETKKLNKDELPRYGDIYQRHPDSIYQQPTESIGSLFLDMFRRKK